MIPAYPRPYQAYHGCYLINLAGNGYSRTSSFATSYVFLAVDFVRPFGALKPYSIAFIRYPFVPDCGFYSPF